MINDTNLSLCPACKKLITVDTIFQYYKKSLQYLPESRPVQMLSHVVNPQC